MFETFYSHETIRLYTSLFGTLFNELKVSKAGKIVGIPLSYLGGDKTHIRTNESTMLDGESARIKLPLPRMTFNLVDWSRDPARQTPKLNRIRENLTDTVKSEGSIKAQYNRVPYVFNFVLSVKTKTLQEIFQVVEQIEANFDPSVHVKVKDNPDLDQNSAIEIRLVGSTFDDRSEGSWEEAESHECTFNFELFGWLYKRTDSGKIINQVDVEFHKLVDFTEEWVSEHITEV